MGGPKQCRLALVPSLLGELSGSKSQSGIPGFTRLNLTAIICINHVISTCHIHTVLIRQYGKEGSREGTPLTPNYYLDEHTGFAFSRRVWWFKLQLSREPKKKQRDISPR